MNRIKSSIFSFLSFLTIAFLSIGSSYWNVNHANKMNFPLTSVSKEEVAYFKDTKGNKRSFTSIEGALAAGKDPNANTVFVVPGTNPTIHNSCAIASGDTLCIPYEGETYDGRQKESQKSGTWKTRATFEKGVPVSGDFIPDSYGYSTTPFADSKKEFVSYFKKNEVTISAGQPLTVSSGAALNIGGILGWEGQIVTGQTSGKYCQITRKANSKIINNGIIDCRGYIKEAEKNSNSEIVNKGTRKLPCVFYDYQGGKYTASVYGGETKIFPLTQYDFPNVQSKRTFNYGSKLIGYVDLFTREVQKTALGATAVLAARHNADDLEIIGPTSSDQKSLFEMSSESSTIVIKRNSSGNLYTTDPSLQPDSTTKIDIKGDVCFQSTQISIAAAGDVSIEGWLEGLSGLLKAMTKQLNQTIDTSAVYFPLPWNILLAVNSNSSLTISSLMKMRPGSEIDVSDTGTLTIGGKLIVYDDSRNSSLFQCPSGNVLNPYPSDKGNAKVLNAGTRTIKQGASFGGLISAIGNSGHINVESRANLTINDCHEGYGDYEIDLKDVSNPVKFTFIDYSNSPVTKSGAAITFERYYKTLRSGSSPNFETSSNERKLEQGTTYSSYRSNSGFGWWSGSHDRYGIQFVYQDDEGNEVQIKDNPNSGVEYLTNNGSDIALQAVTPVDTAAWTFGGFFYDKNCSILVTDNIIKVSEGKSHLINGLLTVYTKWIPKGNFATITWRAYAGTDKLFDQDKTIKIEEADCGVAYDLSAITSTTDSKKKSEVSQVRKIEYYFDYWKVYDSSDESHANLISGNSFIPEKGHAYIAEPVRGEEKFLWRKATNASWSRNKYFVINNFLINNNSSRFTGGLFNAGSVLENTNEQNGWIKLGATIEVSIEDRTGWTEVNTVSIGDGVEKITYKGKNWSGGSANYRIDTNKWVSNFNAFGPIVITCWTKG